jgi:hypothetical protein
MNRTVLRQPVAGRVHRLTRYIRAGRVQKLVNTDALPKFVFLHSIAVHTDESFSLFLILINLIELLLLFSMKLRVS